MLRDLKLIASDKKLKLLIRHSKRDSIPQGEFGDKIPLTKEGVEMAMKFGKNLPFEIETVLSSPVDRCIETAKLIISKEIIIEPILAMAFIDNSRIVGELFLKYTPIEITNMLLSKERLRGMRSIEDGVFKLIKLMFKDKKNSIFITHDYLLALVVSYFMKSKKINKEKFPNFLEGAILWRDNCNYKIFWRDKVYELNYYGLKVHRF